MTEYRIRYNIGKDHAEIDNYHYYMADSAIQALIFHYRMVKKNELNMETIAVERYCKYSEKWFDESSVLEQNISLD
jgi:uncharacterized protein YktB (UPF0637 family)